jgi:hypothetical protein
MATQTETPPTPVGDGDVIAEQGDCIYSIAARTGHAWQTLWDHPRNRDLREARKNPGVLLPGDRVFVPAIEVKSLLLASGKRYRVVIDGQWVTLRLRLCDGDGEPMAQTEYRLCVGGLEIAVRTDDDGVLTATVPAGAEEASLLDVATGETITLRIGHLDPTGSPGAVRKRLANLGYHPGGDEDEMGAELDDEAASLLDDFSDDAALAADATWDARVHQLEAREPWTR